MEQASEKADSYIAICGGHVNTAFYIFLGALTLSALILGGVTLYSKHIYANLDEAQTELQQAKVTLRDKPIFLTADGSIDHKNGDYVRVIPDTQTTMQHGNGKSYPGVYAEVWHKEEK